MTETRNKCAYDVKMYAVGANWHGRCTMYAVASRRQVTHFHNLHYWCSADPMQTVCFGAFSWDSLNIVLSISWHTPGFGNRIAFSSLLFLRRAFVFTHVNARRKSLWRSNVFILPQHVPSKLFSWYCIAIRCSLRMFNAFSTVIISLCLFQSNNKI